jgi:hypothetical protein
MLVHVPFIEQTVPARLVSPVMLASNLGVYHSCEPFHSASVTATAGFDIFDGVLGMLQFKDISTAV